MENWKDIPNYIGLYQVSNLGRVKSLSRVILRKGKYPFMSKEKILKPCLNLSGYLIVGLYKKEKTITRYVHQLVAETFLNHTPCGRTLVVNHKNFIKTDNRVDNLEIVTTRENTNQKHLKSTSKYVGVSWYKNANKWRSDIRINGKLKYLGSFNTELEASQVYQEALLTI